jgi:riboflavin synthase
MFTGIVDGRARVQNILKKGRSIRLRLKVPVSYRRLKLGSSVSVDGVCLTVAGRSAGCLAFDVVSETLKRTRFRFLKPGEALNLEKPLPWKGRVHGHLVQGHADAVARVAKQKARSFQIAYPKKLSKWIVPKGSVALNGVSLTVGKVSGGSFWVHVIPLTFRKTNVGLWKPGTRLNLEADLWLKARFR